MAPNRLISFASIITALALCPAMALRAQDQPPPAGQKSPVDCARCHSCRLPTAEDPCLLHPCTRDRASGTRPTAPHGPDTLVLGQLEDAYLPVPFDHRGHARMADMAEGCATCHHHTPKGVTPPKCESCHDPYSAGTDIEKPGLRGAFHQQCLGCHRDWSNETDCEKCHLRKTGQGGRSAEMLARTDDLLLRPHPVVHEPEGDFFGGPPAEGADRCIVFRHGQHVDRFGLNCVECHHEPNCARCHNGNGEHVPLRPTAHHAPCIRCHKDEMTLAARDTGGCERCHWTKGQPLPGPFDHASTGWPLQRFHKDKLCRDCHREAPFERPSRECRDCHSGWSASNFNHALTGFTLDAQHKEMDCEACHPDQRFDRPPVCTDCHDDLAYPAALPGSRL